MQLKYLPVITCLCLPVTLVITFGLSVYNKHVNYLIPYISDSGTFPPESCIFGQMLNIVSVLMGCAMYIRYRQIKEIFTKHEFPPKNHQFNYITFYIGLLAAIGCSIVANFQETIILSVHWTGAIMAFGMGSIYECFQTIICYNIQPVYGDKDKNCFRAIISMVSMVTFIIFFISGMVANRQFHGNELTKWSKQDGGFEMHCISSVNEWICASCTMIYLLTFVWDFKEVSMSEPEIFVNDNLTVPMNQRKDSGTTTV